MLIYPYAYNDKYCVAFCMYGHRLKTFLIDRMESLQIGEAFEFKDDLYREAQEQIKNIGHYPSKRTPRIVHRKGHLSF